MLNSINQTIYKKCLFPLFFSLFGSVWLYCWDWDKSEVYFEIAIGILILGFFIYALRNIWIYADQNIRSKLYRNIAVFAIMLNLSTYAVSIVFQGVIAFIFAVFMMIGFWNIITR
ncbi:hypothetical protein [Marinilactibacillus psychrotolerans]|uniref:Uncharacterized protein n=2 Tax=Marinilactibacillus psychrotolerans TaxID=191770 RepID=A0A5R9C144_9LACT|nr:hypothetical protein [Marinilactibacillus psychrotolerans]TLQ06419.1 hypothetical protein FEZ48_09915 [Marinilactibacillus psychrotolerans]SJN26375.1 hypothetical protein FM115_03690 [Marinilactibacillus psychrotolerans 42ea]